MSEIKCPWCKTEGWQSGTTTRYACGSSIGCAHQIRSDQCRIIGRLIAEIERLNEILAHYEEECVTADDVDDLEDAATAEKDAEIEGLRAELAEAQTMVIYGVAATKLSIIARDEARAELAELRTKPCPHDEAADFAKRYGD